MIAINVKHILSMADKRPEGYVEEVLSLGEVIDGVLRVTTPEGRRKFVELKKKYSGSEQFQGVKMTQDQLEQLKASRDPKVWGPKRWKKFHASAMKGKITYEWLVEFVKSIPCGDCRDHFLLLLFKHPLEPDNQYLWSVFVHNQVNIKLEKPEWQPDMRLEMTIETRSV